MNVNGIEFLEELVEIHIGANQIVDKYPKMRSLLERVCKDLTSEENIQFSNLFSRLSYVSDKKNLNKRQKYQINSFRINANKVLHDGMLPTEQEYYQDLKALANVLSHFYSVEIPLELQTILPKDDYFKPKQRSGSYHELIRVEVSYTDKEFIYAFAEDIPTEDPIKIRYSIAGINEEFNSTVSKLWKGCQLNLVDVTFSDDGTYVPQLIVLEPDYLIDISSLAECMKEYGEHPLNFIQGKLEPIKNTKYILLGNAANLFLDEFVNEKPTSPVVYAEAMKKAFKSAPIDFSTCDDIDNDFFEETRRQFDNIRNVVNNVFPQMHIDRENAVLEPNFLCEQLGVQGRLDFLQIYSRNEKQFVIELKSGKAPYPDDNFALVGVNHQAQAFIYQLVIQKVLKVKFSDDFRTFIFYSKYSHPTANLRLTKAYMAAIRRIINIRNLIVINENKIASDLTNANAIQIIKSIEPEKLITDNYPNQRFLDNYIIPQINHFKSFFQNASDLEFKYFISFYSFVTREHYLSKAGDIDSQNTKGISSLWLSTVEEKIESGDILIDLSILENNTENDSPTIKLIIPKYNHDFLPNFRKGDIVILYERNTKDDNVTNKQVFKGGIEALTPTEIVLRLRNKQRNKSVLPRNSKYAIEHDFLDSSYSSMYRGLYAFLAANQDRKDLLLNKREPEQDESNYMENIYDSVEVQQIVSKAKIAKDYFLLVGPPGTGKTSVVLKSMVEEFYSDPAINILLLSYTNRAVDEICAALTKVLGAPPFIRIGSELSCNEPFRNNLLEKVIEGCDTRDQVVTKIKEHRIFVGTVSSVSGKTELFKLKTFQVAIIDEASQILEPSLIGILSAKNRNGANAIQKFILIGDHKQLPAVVLQKEQDSAVSDSELQKIGLNNRRNSLFERFYDLHKSDKKSLVWGMLHKQGRMHPDIALFPNYSFYNSQLDIVPTSHQQSELDFIISDQSNPFHQLLVNKRIGFIPSLKHLSDKSNKNNTYEAKIVSELVRNIYSLYVKNGLVFSVEESIGIIAPYRSQIALIKREINSLNIPVLNDISVDTVERFQGSQRDIIIYSFSINQFHQLDFLANNIVDDGQTIDRKLNVAITRAKKQLFVTGNPAILSNNSIYFRFIEFIRSKGGYINAHPDNFIKGNFKIENPDTDIEIGDKIYEPDQEFRNTFDNLIIQPIKSHPKTQYPQLIYGYDHDYNRMNVIEYGRANFDQSTLEHTSIDKVNLYCFYNMRKHYFSSIAIFKSFNDYFNIAFSNSQNRISFLDFGCGPLTSGLAFNQHFSEATNFYFNYIGIDTSNAMLKKAQEFSTSGLFNANTKYQFVNSLNQIKSEYWNTIFSLSNCVILNFSYLFGNLSKEDAEKLANNINSLIDSYPLNKYIMIYQNSSIEKRNRSYNVFKKLVPRLTSVTEPKTETITYRNAIMSNFDKSETVFYELLSN